MATAERVLAIAAGEVGYSRWTDELSGTRYGRWYAALTNSPYFGTNGVPYCAMFVAWVLAQAGQSCPGMPTASCGTALSGARKAGIVRSSKKSAKPGDLVIFDWSGRCSATNHIGFVEKNCGSYIQTIEGNTSSGSSGSQGNGGGVYRRTRSWGVVTAVIAVPYAGQASSGSSALDVDGYWGSATTRRLQDVLGAPYRDGMVSRQNPVHRSRMPACTSGWEWSLGDGSGSQTIRLLQQRVGSTADGIMGSDTIDALIRRYQSETGAVADGRLDAASPTVKAMQRHLNSGSV